MSQATAGHAVGPQESRPPARRKTLVCTRCRTHKVKCNLSLPCSSCVRHGCADQCSYELSDQNRQSLAQHQQLELLHDELRRLRGELYDSNQRLQLARAPGGVAAYQDAAVNRFLHRFSAYYGMSRSWYDRVVTHAMQVGGILNDAVVATSLVLLGADENDSGLHNRGQSLYSQTLGRLQSSLYSERAAESDTLYATMFLALYELVVMQNPLSWLVHINGVCRLILYRGPARHTSPLELETFRFFRPWGVTLGILTRKASFLERDEWKTLPWAEVYPSKDVLDLIADYMVDIPGLIAKTDVYNNFDASDDERQLAKVELTASIRRLSHGLGHWRSTYLFTHPGFPSDLPLDTPDLILSQYVVRNTLLARAFNMYNSLQLQLLRLQAAVGFEAMPLPIQPLATIEAILAVCEGQFATGLVDYTTAISMLFPLRISFYFPVRTDEHMGRIVGLFEKIRAQHRVLLAREICGDRIPNPEGQVNLQTQPTTPIEVDLDQKTTPNSD